MSVRSLIDARTPGSRESLAALAIALAAAVKDPAPLPVDPIELLEAVESRPAAEPGSWQEVREARDDGRLTVAEYDYLAAAVDALTQEEA